MNALIVNCCGMGDGLIEVPFLKHLETAIPSLKYFHTDGILFRDRAFLRRLTLASCVGVVPGIWRKFYRQHWNEILTFMRANEVMVVVNLRHIGPVFDAHYFAFRDAHRDNSSFLEFSFSTQDREVANIRNKITSLFQSAKLSDGCHDRQYLKRLLRSQQPPSVDHIGINVHTGSTFKRWPRHKWHELCRTLLMRGARVTAFAGHTEHEQQFSESVFADFRRKHPDSFAVVGSTDVSQVLEHLSGMGCLVSTDSWPVHAATGIGIKTVGLYIVTSPVLWGGDPPYAFPVESRHLPRCENFEEVLGVCRNRYVTCPLIEREGDGIEVSDVLTAIERCSIDGFI